MSSSADTASRANKPSDEFSAYCDAEFERRLNSGEPFDERLFQRARDMVLDRLLRLEEARRS
jgi:hypothetical protein